MIQMSLECHQMWVSRHISIYVKITRIDGHSGEKKSGHITSVDEVMEDFRDEEVDEEANEQSDEVSDEEEANEGV